MQKIKIACVMDAFFCGSMFIYGIVRRKSLGLPIFKEVILPIVGICILTAIVCWAFYMMPLPSKKHNNRVILAVIIFYTITIFTEWISAGVNPGLYPGTYVAGSACLIYLFLSRKEE